MTWGFSASLNRFDRNGIPDNRCIRRTSNNSSRPLNISLPRGLDRVDCIAIPAVRFLPIWTAILQHQFIALLRATNTQSCSYESIHPICIHVLCTWLNNLTSLQSCSKLAKCFKEILFVRIRRFSAGWCSRLVPCQMVTYTPGGQGRSIESPSVKQHSGLNTLLLAECELRKKTTPYLIIIT